MLIDWLLYSWVRFGKLEVVLVLKIEVTILARPNFLSHLIVLRLCKPFPQVQDIKCILLNMLKFSLSINGIKVFNIDDIMHLIIQVECLAFCALLEFQRHGHLASWLHDLFGAVAATRDFHFFEVGDGFADVFYHGDKVDVEVR